MKAGRPVLTSVSDKVLIIGYGNPLRGDDGLGVRAAALLAEAPWSEGARPEILCCHQLTPELAEPVSLAARVIFIDASCDNSPGTLTCRPVAPDSYAAALTHFAGPAALLACAEQWYGRRPEAVLYSISGQDFGPGEELSPVVAAALPALIQRVFAASAPIPQRAEAIPNQRNNS